MRRIRTADLEELTEYIESQLWSRLVAAGRRDRLVLEPAECRSVCEEYSGGERIDRVDALIARHMAAYITAQAVILVQAGLEHEKRRKMTAETLLAGVALVLGDRELAGRILDYARAAADDEKDGETEKETKGR